MACLWNVFISKSQVDRELCMRSAFPFGMEHGNPNELVWRCWVRISVAFNNAVYCGHSEDIIVISKRLLSIWYSQYLKLATSSVTTFGPSWQQIGFLSHSCACGRHYKLLPPCSQLLSSAVNCHRQLPWCWRLKSIITTTMYAVLHLCRRTMTLRKILQKKVPFKIPSYQENLAHLEEIPPKYSFTNRTKFYFAKL